MKHVNQMRYLYECHVGFEEVSSGIYKVIKDKTTTHPVGMHVAADLVAHALSTDELRVAIFQPNQIYKYANFEL